MRDEEAVEKAYALAAQYAKELEEDNPIESAGPFILMKGLGWVLEEEDSDELFENMEEEFQDLIDE